MSYRERVIAGKKWCYDCLNYYTDYFCGYSASGCKIHGSLDVDQTERHPDRTADTCPNYAQNNRPPWWLKFEDIPESMSKEEFAKNYCSICGARKMCGGVYSEINCGVYGEVKH